MNAVFDDVPVPLSVSTDAAGNISAIQTVLKWPLPPYVAGQKRGSIAVFGVDENYIVQALTSTCNEWTGDACTQVADESTGVSLGGTWARTPANPKPVPGLGLPGLLLLSFGVFGFALRTRRRL